MRADGAADLLELVDLFKQAAAARFARDRVRALGLDARAVEVVDQARRQLAAIARGPARGGSNADPADAASADRALQIAALAGFPDRVARRRADKKQTVVLSGGGAADLGTMSGAAPRWICWWRSTSRSGSRRRRAHGRGTARARRSGSRARSRPSGCWISSPTRFASPTRWPGTRTTERVERASRLAYGAIALEESVVAAPPSPEASRLLAEAAIARGLDAFDEPGVLANQTARIAFVRGLRPDADLPALDEAALRALVSAACEGMVSFQELRAVGMATRLLQALPPGSRATAAHAGAARR